MPLHIYRVVVAVARAFKGLGATVLGYGRSERNPKELDGYFTKTGLSQLLEKCDYLINVLPDTPETRGLLAGEVFQNCKGMKFVFHDDCLICRLIITGRTVFVNIGRGSIIPEADLIKALENKWLRGAILDVFQKEPLPTDSPLYDMDQVNHKKLTIQVTVIENISSRLF